MAKTKTKAEYSRRKVNVREPIPRFLIVCEGERTEPYYFESFRVPTLRVIVRGTGYNTVSLVRAAIELKAKDDYEQTWCVFDRDTFPAENFNKAIRLAKRAGIKVAYSNQAFELWYLLHYDYVITGIDRTHYVTNLEARIGGGYRYKKNSREMYERLIGRQSTAIRHAKTLLAAYDPVRPAEDNPSTTVHMLVGELIKYSR